MKATRIDWTYLWVEEDLRPQEALVAHVNGELLLGDGVDARVLFDPLGTVCVVFVELLHEVGTHVAETFLNNEKLPLRNAGEPTVLKVL